MSKAAKRVLLVASMVVVLAVGVLVGLLLTEPHDAWIADNSIWVESISGHVYRYDLVYDKAWYDTYCGGQGVDWTAYKYWYSTLNYYD